MHTAFFEPAGPGTFAAAAPPPVPPAPAPGSSEWLPWEGYGTAMEWRFVSGGGITVPGPATAWMRPAIPLLPGEEMSPMSRALLVADSGSGLSAVLDLQSFMFINVDLSLRLHRDPEGEWLLMDAVTTIGPNGTGVATSTMSDQAGPVGLGSQALLVAPR